MSNTPGTPRAVADAPASPLRYDPSVETPEADEAETSESILDSMRKIREKTFQDYGRAVRSVHAKSHGVLKGELEIPADLPPVLAQGLFARPGRYPAVLRFSTTPGDILDDTVSTPRGVAIKILNVRGDRLPGAEEETTQDFVLVNGPAFQSGAKAFAGNLKLLEKTTDTLDRTKKVLSTVSRGLEHLIEAFGGESAKLKALGGHPATHILGETFFSQAALRWGDHIAKVSVAPVSPELVALTGTTVSLDSPTALRDAVVDFFHRHGGVWEIRAQLCTDLETMPVEDASVLWPEDRSPYICVGRITVQPQDAWSDSKVAAIDEGLSFSPWHCLAAHRPLGVIMRLRRKAYEMSAQFRATHNGHPIREPKVSDTIPG
ncbi:catalase family protein [Microvirga pudoricolor]|uniref:catalase family protein n=1 Tax=Microvirga pudoricolor TaxID=2778729 RepID=UPI0019519E23|nr:catalase family protein [Microvirga pudoricolor]MBM6592726.1 catalase family protein [Microvirga pudoricolor]